jgi:hypothetical protein
MESKLIMYWLYPAKFKQFTRGDETTQQRIKFLIFQSFYIENLAPKIPPNIAKLAIFILEKIKSKNFPIFLVDRKNCPQKNTHTWQSCHGSKRHATFCVHTEYPSTPFLPHAEGG